ncbi:hypothetical protein QBC33DRAFT_515217 [Phialemonium atrogriseum]|uniref:Uncharacterized protein n=1 Tax=Phialemonium atrogriseum TaxID=1093897 RepID=A0AAJ0FL65_9PEZI|nr:uncharacterized protein QBC33DRAFT_515217 [Phialemonium atrogriseum]KAK1767038.1 hypothetical protein QBC33DRAFT_515217 [Phialemonium atrogriseum]
MTVSTSGPLTTPQPGDGEASLTHVHPGPSKRGSGNTPSSSQGCWIFSRCVPPIEDVACSIPEIKRTKNGKTGKWRIGESTEGVDAVEEPRLPPFPGPRRARDQSIDLSDRSVGERWAGKEMRRRQSGHTGQRKARSGSLNEPVRGPPSQDGKDGTLIDVGFRRHASQSTCRICGHTYLPQFSSTYRVTTYDNLGWYSSTWVLRSRDRQGWRPWRAGKSMP